MRNNLATLLATAAIALSMAAPLAHAAEVGKPAPAFTLTDVEGKTHSLADFKGKTVVLEWFNHDCPYVVKHYKSNNMQDLQKKYTGKDVVWLSINSTNEKHENYTAPDRAKELAASKNVAAIAVALDADGKVGKAYDAKTTPHMYIINPEGTLVYNGAIDDQPKADGDPKEAKPLFANALDQSLAGEEVKEPRSKPYGCSVKYP